MHCLDFSYSLRVAVYCLSTIVISKIGLLRRPFANRKMKAKGQYVLFTVFMALIQ